MSRLMMNYPFDGRGEVPPNCLVWTGEIQSIAFVTASSAATAITIPGRLFEISADQDCHIVFGNANVNAAHATATSRCYPIWAKRKYIIYVPDGFDTLQDGTGTLYVRVLRNSADGRLYIAQALPSDDSAGIGATTTTTTTTTTSTTTTTTTTTTT